MQFLQDKNIFEHTYFGLVSEPVTQLLWQTESVNLESLLTFYILLCFQVYVAALQQHPQHTTRP